MTSEFTRERRRSTFNDRKQSRGRASGTISRAKGAGIKICGPSTEEEEEEGKRGEGEERSIAIGSRRFESVSK